MALSLLETEKAEPKVPELLVTPFTEAEPEKVPE